MDATIVRVPIQRNTRKKNEAIKEGKPPVENWSEAKKCQKDTDARWTKKRGKSYFGYKNHVEVDVKHKLIRKNCKFLECLKKPFIRSQTSNGDCLLLLPW